MPPLVRTYDQGIVTAVERRDDLAPGECQTLTGVWYKPGDAKRIHKFDGRSTFGDTTSAAEVKGVAVLQFDSGGTDRVVAFSGSTLYSATPGASGTFSSLITGLTGANLDVAHENDRFYLVFNGAGQKNKVIEADGSTYDMGMQSPPSEPTATAGVAGTEFPAGAASGFTNSANTRDGDKTTYGYALRNTAGTTTLTLSGYGSDTGSGRVLALTWALAGRQFNPGDRIVQRGRVADTGARPGGDFDVNVKIEISENSGSTFTTVFNANFVEPQFIQTFQHEITNGVNLTAVQVKVSHVYNGGANNAVLRVHDSPIFDAPNTGNFSTTTGFYYAYTEYDQARGEESPPSPITARVTLSTQNHVKLSGFAAAQNSRATHRNIYRTPDGGAVTQLGLIGQIDITKDTFIDDFKNFSATEQPGHLVASVTIEVAGISEPIILPRDTPPPALRRITAFQNGLVGLTTRDNRELAWAIPGLPGSWPELNLLNALPAEERDDLVDIAEAGDSLIIAASQVMFRLDALPRSVQGSFIVAAVKKIAGAPGCVGPEALTVVSYDGRSHVAWISPEDGILVTDGHTWGSISRDIDWTDFDGFTKSNWLLRWHKNMQVLVFAYSSTATGTNNRYYLLHLAEKHRKTHGQVKVTGPHYGAINAMAIAEVAGTTRVYEAHPTDGRVYLNFNAATGADSANAYNASGELPMIVKSRRYREDWISWEAHDAALRHSDFGAGQVCTFDYLVGRDSSGHEATRSQSVSLAGQKRTQFDIARSGEFHEETFTHVGTGRGSITDLTIRAQAQGDEGDVSDAA